MKKSNIFCVNLTKKIFETQKIIMNARESYVLTNKIKYSIIKSANKQKQKLYFIGGRVGQKGFKAFFIVTVLSVDESGDVTAQKIK
ncbi:MAG: hypothetical protein ACI4C1_02355 [Lachnospiraceae bacterium]